MPTSLSLWLRDFPWGWGEDKHISWDCPRPSTNPRRLFWGFRPPLHSQNSEKCVGWEIQGTEGHLLSRYGCQEEGVHLGQAWVEESAS